MAFGPFDERGGRPSRGAALGDVQLRGRIDRIDLDADGRAVVHDYKTGKWVTRADKFSERGTLQIQLYMRVAQASSGWTVGGLYHPLGAVGERNPRGVVAREDEDLKGLGIVGTDRLEHDDLELALDEAEELAQGLRAGDARGRDPPPPDRRPVHDIAAVAVFLDHLLQAADLAFNPAQPLEIRRLDVGVHRVRMLVFHMCRSRKLFITTLTELKAIAALAITGLSRTPNGG